MQLRSLMPQGLESTINDTGEREGEEAKRGAEMPNARGAVHLPFSPLLGGYVHLGASEPAVNGRTSTANSVIPTVFLLHGISILYHRRSARNCDGPDMRRGML